MSRKMTALILLLGLTSQVAAQSDLIAERHRLMRLTDKATAAGSKLMLSKFNAEKAAAATRTIRETQAVFVTLFPPGSSEGDTLAKPEVWDQPDLFREMSDDLIARAAEAEVAVDAGSMAFARAWSKVLTACTACHSHFRN